MLDLCLQLYKAFLSALNLAQNWNCFPTINPTIFVYKSQTSKVEI